jgi:hypothetical protein
METVIGSLAASQPWGPSEDACRPLLMVIGPCRPTGGDGLGAYAANLMAARHVVETLTGFGVAAFCPMLSHQLMDGILPPGEFIRIGLVLAARCDAVVRLPGWEGSEGCQAVVAFLRGLCRGATYFDWPAGQREPMLTGTVAACIANWASKFTRERLSNSPVMCGTANCASPYPATPMATIRNHMRRSRHHTADNAGSRGPEPAEEPRPADPAG